MYNNSENTSTSYNVYAASIYVLLLLVLCPLFVFALPMRQPTSGNFIYSVCRIWSSLWCKLVGIRYIRISENTNQVREPRIYVANHRCYLDIVSLTKTMDRPLRILGRHDIGTMPILGWFYDRIVITVDRKDMADRIDSLERIKQVLDSGLSIFIFPEGTFNTGYGSLSKFHQGAFHLAIETQTPIVPIIFPDNKDLMHHSGIFSMKPGITRAILLTEVDVQGYNRTDVRKLMARVYNYMDDQLKTYEKIPPANVSQRFSPKSTNF